jgi:hypothetical protein
MYSGEYDACDVTQSISTPGKLEKYAWPGHGGKLAQICPPWPGIFFKLARCGYIHSE